MGFLRLSSFFLALVWLALGAILATIGTISFLFTTAQGMRSTALWFDVRDFVVYDLFFGQIPVGPASSLLLWVPLVLLFLSTLPLYSAFQHLRYAVLQDRAGLIPFAVTMSLLFIILLITLNTGLTQLFNGWSARVEDLRASAVASEDIALSAAIDPDDLRAYRQSLSELRFGSSVFIVLLIAFTIPLLTSRPRPDRAFHHTHLERRDDQCVRCGLIGLQGQLPECVLCQTYYDTHIARLPLGDLAVSGDEDGLPALEPGDVFQIRVTIEPRRGVPAHNIEIVIDTASAFAYVSHGGMTARWSHELSKGQSHEIVLRGPEYLSNSENLDITLRVSDHLKLRQRNRIKRHVLKVQTRSDDLGTSGRPQVIEVLVERQQRRAEVFISRMWQWLVRLSSSAFRYTNTSLRERIRRLQTDATASSTIPSGTSQQRMIEEPDSHESLAPSETGSTKEA